MNTDHTGREADTTPAAGRVVMSVSAAIERAVRHGGDPAARIGKALDIAVRLGGVDGAHHKAWVIDQMVRALTGCPMETRTAKDYRGEPYTYEAQADGEHYMALVAAACDGEEGPDTYTWDTGIAP